MRTTMRLLAALAMAVLAAPSAMAGSDECTGSGCTAGPLDVTFSVTIPSFVRFQLGDAVGTPDVQFNTGVNTANVGNGTPVSADTVTNGGAGANGQDQVLYVLLSNAGGTDVTISAAGVGAGLTSPGGDTIPYSEIESTTTAVTGAAVDMPPEGGSTAVAPTAGLVDREGYWNYTFGNSALYPGGTYTGTIEYTATHNP